MQTRQFLDLLAEHSEKELIFEYSLGNFVPVSYHITEVKNVHIESVDCGGRPAEYDQTVIQLWVNEGEVKEQGMTAEKALKIIHIVDKVKPLRRDTDLFFEWGHGDLLTSNYQVKEVKVEGDKLTLQMFVPPTVCKPMFELEMATGDSGACTPGGGCC